MEPSLPFYLGFGYRSYIDRFGPARIIDQSHLTPAAPVDARVESKFGFLVSQEDFESVFSADAAMSGSSGAFSASATASFSRQFNRSQTSVSIAFTRKVVTGIFRIAEYPVTEDAKRDAANPLRFIRSFGDSVVSGVGMGGACCYLFRFDFSSEKEATDFKLGVNARYGSGSGSFSQEQKDKIEKTKASVSFSGYTTGTLSVPKLFKPEASEGTNFLFSAGFRDTMITGLLDYFDTFPANFKVGEVAPGYSQCERESESLSNVPLVLPNQDDIGKLGRDAHNIADILGRQLDTLNAIDAQLSYVSRVPDCNIPTAVDEAKRLQETIHGLQARLKIRMSGLVDDSDLESPFDFRNEFPALPSHLCTADPRLVASSWRNPRGSWRYADFQIHPADFDKTCWIEALADISAVRHRPNGGHLRLQLIKTALPQANVVSPNLPMANALPADEIVDDKSAKIVRGGEASLRVGGFAFIPRREGVSYKIGVYTDGDYRGRSVTRLQTKKSRQSEIES